MRLFSILASIFLVTNTNDIQPTINLAVNGDTILVDDGVYGAINLAYKNIEVKSINGPYYTILDGGNTTRTVYMQKSTLTEGEPVVSGFSIINGAATDGAGVYIKRGGILDNCFVMYNHATNFGGGVYEVKTDYGGVISNCIIAANTAQTGGGLYMYLGGDVYNTHVYMNTAFIADNIKLEAHNVYGGTINGLMEAIPSNWTTYVNFNMTATNLTFDFTTLIGRRYNIEQSTNLLNVGSVIYNQYGTGFLIHQNIEFNNNRSFYKIYCLKN